ncbi:hypothetical protein GPECTOR_246g603 [Gonium pectorale]|uniref:Uncharacterized protein n=1 Tax=Gonium pectorale TaxID=33097 RepID=A0A150FY10_GONPE|nr:hypothetical protein GPECTOR_246g603 [Gonium pectorale]|eukprot:KXZ41910.1 hypothetical protein GPECTOR_246g603 [Gonium pectorale]
MEFQKTYLKNTNISVREYFEGMLAQFPSLRCLLVVEEYANARNTNNNKASWRIRRVAPAVEASKEQAAEVIAALGEWHGGLSLDQHRQQVQLEEADFAALASLADDLAGAAMSTPAASHGHRNRHGAAVARAGTVRERPMSNGSGGQLGAGRPKRTAHTRFNSDDWAV